MAIIDSKGLISIDLRFSCLILLTLIACVVVFLFELKIARTAIFSSIYNETSTSTNWDNGWINYTFPWPAIPRKGDPGICIAAQLDFNNELYIRSTDAESKLLNRYKVRHLDIVLARHKESLPDVRQTIFVLNSIPSVRSRDPLYFIISKSSSDDPNEIFSSLLEVDVVLRQANFGREAVAYLVYLIRIYDYLPDHVIFLQACPNEMMENVVPRLQGLFHQGSHLGVLALGGTDHFCQLQGPCHIGPTQGALDVWHVFRGGDSDPEDLKSGRSIDVMGAKLFTLGGGLGEEDRKSDNNNDGFNSSNKNSVKYRLDYTDYDLHRKFGNFRSHLHYNSLPDPFPFPPPVVPRPKFNVYAPLSSPGPTSSSLLSAVPPPELMWVMLNGQFLVSRKRILQNSIEKYKWALGFILGASGGHKESYVVPESFLKNMTSSHLNLDNLQNRNNTFIARNTITVPSTNSYESTTFTGSSSNNIVSKRLAYKLKPMVLNAENLTVNSTIEWRNYSNSGLNPDLDPGPTFWDLKAYFAYPKVEAKYYIFKDESLISCDNTLSLHVMERAW
eukprot:CAMPEP_0175062734 /NCGR_PEP_ID=MMETSP0052_2-20121109/14339_1 /TAXON_ID=51329 ORGANISM="Polytomella parva, Strain SAG 63-3" /NCGR_SAMPLE_ID=MMETSP0052_2 /ASSEMBLY_ACC=CAM_ASM_000194 /LENGTH=558 /DNA_ID=CAMNT_0016328801 /DNA_START=212 /DNA_END=1885 /DNA_ORIENTATION=+